MVENTIKMPKRFDYSASGDFNSLVATILNDTASDGKQILLDCSQMDYIDSAGIGLIVMAHKKAMANHVPVVVINAKSSTKEIFLLANLQKLIEIR